MYVFLCMYYAYTEVRARYKVHSATSREKVSFLTRCAFSFKLKKKTLIGNFGSGKHCNLYFVNRTKVLFYRKSY